MAHPAIDFEIALVLAFLGLASMIALQTIFIRRKLRMAQQAFQDLTAAVKHSTSVKQAALVLIQQMGAKLDELAQHPTAEAIQALASELRQHGDELAREIAERADE